jgi:hypothetical protein
VTYIVPHNYLNLKCEFQPAKISKSLIISETSGNMLIDAHLQTNLSRLLSPREAQT